MKITEEFALMLEIFEENHRFIKTIKNYSNSYIEFMNKCDENYYNFTLKMNNIISGGTELEQNEFVDELTQYLVNIKKEFNCLDIIEVEKLKQEVEDVKKIANELKSELSKYKKMKNLIIPKEDDQKISVEGFRNYLNHNKIPEEFWNKIETDSNIEMDLSYIN